MTAFGLLAAAFVLAALGFLLWPLLRGRARATASTQAANLAVYRDQFAELERDLELGTLDNAQYEAARTELQRLLLQEAGEGPAVAAGGGRGSRATAVLIALALPVAAAGLYALLGQPQGIGVAKRTLPDDAPVSPEQFQAMTEQLAQRMRQNPDDALGWLMLGRAYKALQRPADAVEALAKAYERQPADADIMIEYAEALAQAGGTLLGQPRQLLDRALSIAPNDAKALTMAGGAAFEAKDYAAAIGYWEKLSLQLPKDSELGQALASGIARARALQGGASSAAAVPSAAGRSIRGQVRIVPALKNDVAPDDMVFIFARAAQGARMPLAIVRKQVKDLPAAFVLDDSSAMGGQARLSDAREVVLTARVSRSGNASAASGDLQGESAAVAPGASGVVITIDRVLP